MTHSHIRTTLALTVALILSACSGSQDALTTVPDATENNRAVIGDPNAKGTIGIRNHNQLRGALYAMIGFPAPVAALDTFLTTNRQTFNGAGDVKSVTPEEIQKRVEASFLACTSGVTGRATNNLGPLLAGWNFGAGPAGVTDALVTSFSSGLWQLATGESQIPADVLNSIISFKPTFITGAPATGATTSALAASICSAILSSPKAIAVL